MIEPNTFLHEFSNLTTRTVSTDRRLAITIIGIRGIPTVRILNHDAYEHFQRFGGLDTMLTDVLNEAVDESIQKRKQLIRTGSALRVVDEEHMSEDTRKRIETKANIESYGESLSGLIEITTWGRQDWECLVDPEALDLPMATCVSGINTAIAIACRSHSDQVRALRSRQEGRKA